MSFEHVFTSVPKGLKPGSRGFSSVAFTEGMPANYVQFCESISGYVHLFTPEDPNYTKNPPAFSHLLASLGGRTFSILSRVGSCGIDYTGRTNKLAHHVMLSPDERTISGPAVLMSRGGLFLEQWSGEPRFFPSNNVNLASHDVSSFKASTWEKMMGEADGAGILAQSFLDNPTKPTFILFDPGMDILPLLSEAQALLPASRRWDVTFNTYFTTLPVGMDCAWRCCLPNSEALKVARRTPGVLIIDLPNRRIDGPRPVDTRLVETARTGQPPEPERQVLVSPVHKPSLQPSLGQRGPANRPPQRLRSGPIQMDYSDALRPRPPKKVANPMVNVWLSIAAVFVVAIGVLLILKWSRQNDLQKQDGSKADADINPPAQSNVSSTNVSNNPNQDTDFPAKIISAFTENNSTDPKNEVGDQPKPVTNDEAIKSSPKYLVLAEMTGSKIRFNQDADAKFGFWSTNGSAIHFKTNPGDGGTLYVTTDTSQPITLARRKPEDLSSIDGSVQLIEVNSAVTSRLYVCKSLYLDSSVLYSNGEFRLTLPQTDASHKLIEYLKGKENELVITGEKNKKTDTLKIGSQSFGKENVITGALEENSPLLNNERELAEKVATFSNTVASLTAYKKELSVSVENISNNVAKFKKAKETAKEDSKAKGFQKGGKKDKENDSLIDKAKEDVRKSVQDSLTTFLSNQTFAAQPPRPIDQFNSFKMKFFDAAKKKADDNKRTDLINAYDHNDSKGLCELVGYFSDEELCSFGSAMYFGNTLLIPRIKQLADAATSSQKDLEDSISKLRIAQKLPLKISVKHKQISIFEGTTSPK